MTVPIPVRSAIIMDLHDGLTHRAIAARHGVNPSCVARISRDQGLVKRRSSHADLVRSGTIRVATHASFTSWFLTMPDEVVNWVVDQTPKGSRASDIVRAIIIDAYNGER